MKAITDYTFSVDFGTSNSVVYVLKNNQYTKIQEKSGQSNFLFPSFIQYHTVEDPNSSEKKLVVNTGYSPKENTKKPLSKGKNYIITAVKRLIGLTYDEYLKLGDKDIFGCEVVRGDDGYPYFIVDDKNKQVSCIEAASELFKEFKSRVNDFCHPKEYNSIYLTIPANYGKKQSDAIRQAAELAGLQVETFIPEPSAAAFAYLLDNEKQPIQPQEKILVYDFGGGTFDASLLTVKSKKKGLVVMGVEGDNKLGGNDIDTAFMKYIQSRIKEEFQIETFIPEGKNRNRKLMKFRAMCEDAKINLMSNSSHTMYLSDINEDVESIQLFQFDLNNCIEPLINRTMDCVMKVLNKHNLNPGNIRHIILVGGSSRLQLVKTKLEEKFKNSTIYNDDPDFCVSLGALKLIKYGSSISSTVSSSYGLQATSNSVVLLIKKGSQLPLVTRRFSFLTTVNNQKNVDMKIYRCNKDIKEQGKIETVGIKECEPIYDLKFDLVDCNVNAENYSVEIEFSFSMGGVLEVFCYHQDKLIHQHTYKPIYGDN